jgi:hypothetical protein
MRVCRRCRMGINQPCQVSWAHFISKRHRGAAIPRKCAKLLPNLTGGPQPAVDVGGGAKSGTPKSDLRCRVSQSRRHSSSDSVPARAVAAALLTVGESSRSRHQKTWRRRSPSFGRNNSGYRGHATTSTRH